MSHKYVSKLSFPYRQHELEKDDKNWMNYNYNIHIYFEFMVMAGLLCHYEECSHLVFLKHTCKDNPSGILSCLWSTLFVQY